MEDRRVFKIVVGKLIENMSEVLGLDLRIISEKTLE